MPFSDCKSQAEYYRRIIDIENEYSPLEIAGLWIAKDSLPETVLPWLKKILEMMTAGSQQVRKYLRLKISNNVNLFQTPSSDGKSLLLCFCGSAHRMMMPIASFLQFIPEDKFDVVIVRDPSLHRYLLGIPGYQDDLLKVIDQLIKDVPLNKYIDIRCIGCSAGGAAALYSGVILNAKRALSIGGGHPAQSHLMATLKAEGLTGYEFDQFVQKGLDRSSTELFAVFGVAYASDKDGAMSLKRNLPECRLAEIENLDHHNILNHLLKNNALNSFIERFLIADKVS